MTNEYLKQYADLILTDKIPTCKKIKRQYEMLWNDLHNPKIVTVRNEFNELENREFVFDIEKANKPIEFMEQFCMINNQGKLSPMRLALFQKASNQALYGFVDKETGLRLYKERLTIIGRKNGKTTEKAANGNYMMIADNEYAAQVANIATSRDQAMLLFNPATAIIRNSSVLSKVVKKRKTDLYYANSASSFKPLATKVNSLDGLELHYGIIDEIHASKGRELYDDLVQSVSSRRQPIVDIISTFGFIREDIFDNLYDEATKELFNEDFCNPRKLKFIYELDDKKEIDNSKLWVKANPGLGTIKQYSYMEEKLNEAKKNPSLMPTVLTKDFNLPQTKAGTWLTWEELVNETTVEIDFLKNSYAIGGCDLSAVGDLTCGTLMIRKPSDNNFYFIQHYFIPESKLKRVEESKEREAPYRKWAEQGHVTICSGEQIEFSYVTKWFLSMVNDYNIRPLDIGFDRALSGYWVPEMENYGFKLTKIAQGAYTWSQPMKEMKALFAEKRVIYQNNPVTRWCLSNVGAKITSPEQAITTMMPVKLSANKRIDGFVSMLNAYTCYLKVYEEYMPYVK